MPRLQAQGVVAGGIGGIEKFRVLVKRDFGGRNLIGGRDAAETRSVRGIAGVSDHGPIKRDFRTEFAYPADSRADSRGESRDVFLH